MGSVISIIGSAAASAVAFSGTNYEFSKLSDHGSGERERHDKAIEKLQNDRDSWFKERQQRLDFINERLQKERHAERTFKNVDAGMHKYYLATQHKLKPLRKYPVSSDYYHPSEKQKNGEIAIILGSLTLTGFVVYKYL